MSKFELKSNKSREYRSKTFRLPADLLNALEQRAQEKELSLNQAVIQCFEYAVKAMDSEE